MIKKVFLKDIINDMHQGVNTVTEKVEYVDKGFPIIQSKNITTGVLDLADVRYIDQETYDKYKCKYNPQIDDLLVCNIGTIGKSLLIEEEENFIIAWNLFLIKLNKNVVFPKYLKYYFEYLRNRGFFDTLLTGGTVKFISKTKMGNIQVPLPDYKRQVKIAAILDKAYSLINKRKAQIEALDQLTQSLFLEMFGDTVNNPMNWKTFKLDDVYEIIDGDRGKHYPKQNEFYYDGYCLFLNTGNVTKNGFNFDKTQFITQEKDEVLRKGKLERYDLVLTTRGTVGNIAYYDDKVPYDNIRINSGMVILREKININPIFFTYYFRNPSIYKRLISGTAQPQMPISNLRKAKIYYPPLNLQNKFGDLAHNIESKKNQMKKSLEALEDNFNSLMQRAFKGELFTDEKVSKL